MASFSNLKGILTALFIMLMAPLAFCDELKFEDAKTDQKGNVVFTYVIENLPLNATEGLEASLKYLENEYKTTKYKEIEHFADKGIAYGKGHLNSFYTDNGMVKSEVFSTDYFLRLDAKDNKVRVQLIFTNYNVLTLSDTSNKESMDVAISSVAPFADAKDNGRYKKAFKALTEKANIVLKSVSEKLRAFTPAPVMDEW
ncbi:MAG: hypothetical protein PUD39_05460 [Bacteroidales bacterium]|nr:hypothetical protein [Bacteroidales bacterium]